MSDPYEILGIDGNADQEQIRGRYLELVRQYPPEREPSRFAEIRAAYDQVRDPVVNLQNRLFGMKTPQTLADLARDVNPGYRRQRLSTKFLLSLADS